MPVEQVSLWDVTSCCLIVTDVSEVACSSETAVGICH